MKERLVKALDAMVKRRDILLDQYLLSLDRSDWTMQESMTAIETAGRLHDCDRHITNLHMESKRLGLQEISDQSKMDMAVPELTPAQPAPDQGVANAS